MSTGPFDDEQRPGNGQAGNIAQQPHTGNSHRLRMRSEGHGKQPTRNPADERLLLRADEVPR